MKTDQTVVARRIGSVRLAERSARLAIEGVEGAE